MYNKTLKHWAKKLTLKTSTINCVYVVHCCVQSSKKPVSFLLHIVIVGTVDQPCWENKKKLKRFLLCPQQSPSIQFRYIKAVAVLGKNIWGAGPSSFGKQQRLSEITIEPIKNLGGLCPLNRHCIKEVTRYTCTLRLEWELGDWESSHRRVKDLLVDAEQMQHCALSLSLSQRKHDRPPMMDDVSLTALSHAHLPIH